MKYSVESGALVNSPPKLVARREARHFRRNSERVAPPEMRVHLTGNESVPNSGCRLSEIT